MRRYAALLLLGLGGLLLTAGGQVVRGAPDVPGDPTPPVITPVIFGTLGANGWYVTNVTVNWQVSDPESAILWSTGCDAVTLTADTVGVRLTCTAASDGGETSVSKTFKIDKTAPSVTTTPDRAADSNGWYNHGVTVSYTGTDATSGIATCSTPQSYSGPDTAGASVSGSCTDNAGNRTARSFGLDYDATAPQVSGASASRAADSNGWYNHALTVNFAGTDATSGIDTCTQTGYAGPDSSTASVNGTCRDRAGNQSASGVFGFRYDATDPQITATPSRGDDANGWYRNPVTVTYTGTDATSGVESCVAPQSYSGPDSGSASVNGTCRDRAGNSNARSFALRYDATAPQASAAASRPTDSNGWYNHALTVSFTGSDPMSGLAGCTPQQSYSGPDNGSAAVAGSCSDLAGNVNPMSFPLRYDATAPTVSGATPGRAADSNGWYNHTISFAFQGTDAISGLDACTQTSYSGPDSGSASVSGSCSDRAGNQSGAIPFGFRYDGTGPAATATPSRAADSNGWYNHSLTVSFAGSDPVSGLAACSPVQTYAGPDNASASVAGSCSDRAGNTTPRSFALSYDASGPTVTATPSRASDSNGWYNHALTISFAGSDPMSGLGACSASQSYSGPDNGAASVSGSCSDRAGNTTPQSFALRYDATGPQTSATAGRAPDVNGWYNHALTVSFAGSDAMSGVDSCTAAQTYSGPDTAQTDVGGSCLDRAGNVGPAAYRLKYDATAPQATATASRAADANGWYRSPLNVSFAGTDAMAGIDSCTAQQTYSGPDSSGTSVGGSCLDRAGNVAPASFALRYDATAPQASASAGRGPDLNGWYNHALTVSFSGSDGLSGLDSCTAPQTYSSPDNASAAVSGSCRDLAGNSATRVLAFRYDATGPSANATPSRAADVNGWYNHSLTVTFSGTDAMSGLDTCSAPQSYAGPDNAGAVVNGSCSDRAGNSTGRSFALSYDATAPGVTATPSRVADRNGWYNHALTVSFAGSDPTSGVDACTAQQSYSGPDGASASVSGSCTDRAGNSAGRTLGFSYDDTAPQSTATPSRGADANGWYRNSLTVSFAGTDATAGVESCTAVQTYAGPDTAQTDVGGSCLDRAGNVGPASYTLKYDATAPQATATASRVADSNGWYNHALTVSFSGSDAMSGLDVCTTPQTYSGPDAASASVSGSCRDRAGNGTDRSLGLSYDATAPQVSAAPSRAADENGWYNHALTVSFAGSDGMSQIDVCSAPQSYSGPDSANAAVSGSCRDRAGNSTVRVLVLGYDATAPQVSGAAPARQPDANGWYNHPLALSFQGTDGTSGVNACTQVTYAGPDNANAAVSGSCRDRAGNQSGSSSFDLKYDASDPEVTNAVAARTPDRAGWYNHAVAFAFQGTDATAGVAVCPGTTYQGPDSGTAAVAGSCVDEAGNRGVALFPLKYDGTGPQVSATPGRVADANGWYNHSVDVSFQGRDPVAGIESCAAPLSYTGPDSKLVLVRGSCVDKAGNAGLGSFVLGYDTTAPQVTGANPARAPDANGWYNHPVGISFTGSDATSGVDGCTQASYGGPDNDKASVSGSCRDLAGNQSGAGTFGLKYDGTTPSVTDVKVKTGDRIAVVSWRTSRDTVAVEVARTAGARGGPVIVYRGTGDTYTDRRLKNGVRYRYAVNGYDEARNEATRSVVAVPQAPLYRPAAGARLSSPPVLAWKPAPRATYYNVQLWRKGRKIFSGWPWRTSLRLKRAWVSQGRAYRLTQGVYHWYVWPGYGRPSARRFGPLLGSSSFVITP